MTSTVENVGIIGCGEVGTALASRIIDRGKKVTVTSRSLDGPQVTLAGTAVSVAPNSQALAEESDLVISCVWPETALETAVSAASSLSESLYVDLNSVSPKTVGRIQETIHDAGGNFLNGSIMDSVSRHGADVPLFVSGPVVETGAAHLRSLGFTVRSLGTDPNRVAVLKMCRSAITKGLLPLFAEALLPARRYNVHEAVLDSVDESFSDMTLGEFARYFLVDMTDHGKRRSGELEEVISMIEEEGFDASVSERARWLSKRISQLDGDEYQHVLQQLEEDFYR